MCVFALSDTRSSLSAAKPHTSIIQYCGVSVQSRLSAGQHSLAAISQPKARIDVTVLNAMVVHFVFFRNAYSFVKYCTVQDFGRETSLVRVHGNGNTVHDFGRETWLVRVHGNGNTVQNFGRETWLPWE